MNRTYFGFGGPDFGFGPGGPGFGGGPRWRARARMFDKGDLKYVLLDLLSAGPAHGYELIRLLESRFGGWYTPSPGAVYPTLQLLEDLGHVTVSERDGKRVYSITEAGTAFLNDNRRSVDDIWNRFGGPRGDAGDLFREIRNELRGLGAEVRSRVGRIDTEQVQRIREVVMRSAGEIRAILENRDGTRS